MNIIPTLQFATICDEVTIKDGKFSAIGIFEQINAMAFPAIHKQFFVLTRWSNGAGNNFLQKVIIKRKEDDKELFDSTPLEKEFTLADTNSYHTITGQVADFYIEKPGDYLVEFYLNEVKQKTEIFFKVVETKFSFANRVESRLPLHISK